MNPILLTTLKWKLTQAQHALSCAEAHTEEWRRELCLEIAALFLRSAARLLAILDRPGSPAALS